MGNINSTDRQEAWRFEKEEIIYHARRARVPEDYIVEICDFLTLAQEDRTVLQELIAYYSLLFLDEKIIYPIEEIYRIPISKSITDKYRGTFYVVLFLAAARHFETFVKEKELDSLDFDFLESYYKNLRRFMEMNHTSSNSYGLTRLMHYVYGYARPFLLQIGRLSYELLLYQNDVFDVYEKGDKRIFVAKRGTEFDRFGFPLEKTEGARVEKKQDGCLRLYNERGFAVEEINELDLTGWTKILNSGELVFSIHIPGNEKLSEEAILQSLKHAIPILRKVFDKWDAKNFICTSWLLSPQVRKFVNPDSNIAKFQNLFDIVGWYDADYAVYEHIFCTAPCPKEQLIPKSKLQKSVLDIYRCGGKLHDGFGVLRYNDEKLEL